MANAKGTAHSVYPEYSIGGWIIMLGWRSSGFSPLPSGGALRHGLERRDREDEQGGEEGAEAQQHRRRVGRHVAQAPAHEEEHEARPQRQQPHPQQQRALLRGPRRRRAVEGRRRGRGVRGHHVEVEVRAQEGDLEDREGRASSAAPARRPSAARSRPSRAARCAPRRARRRCRRRTSRGRGSGRPGLRGPWRQLCAAGLSVNFDGHFVTSESFSPTNSAAALAHRDDDLAPVAEGVGHRPHVAHGHRGAAVAVAHAEERRVAALLDRPVHDLARELVGAPGVGAGQQPGGLDRRAGRGEARVGQRTGQQETAAVRATTRRMRRLREGSMRCRRVY